MSRDSNPFAEELRQHVYRYDKWAKHKRPTFAVRMSMLGKIYSRLSSTKGYVLNGGISKGYVNALVNYDYKIRNFPGQLKRYPNISFGGNGDLRYFEKAIEEIHRTGINREVMVRLSKEYSPILQALSEKLEAEGCIALVVPSDVGVVNKMFIKAANCAGIPTILFHHGAVPVQFSKPGMDATDYLVVWGELTKEAYISKGWDASKIKVSGSPAHSDLPDIVRCSSKRVLVCTKPRSHSICQDAWDSIRYIDEVRQVLLRNGVTRAKLRPHPSENPKLYEPFMDDFFEISLSSIEKTLSEIDIVIGPQSAFIVDSYYSGVSYLVYEPIQKHRLLFHNQDLSPVIPVNSNRISVSQSPECLFRAVQNPFQPSPSYIESLARSELDISFFREILRPV